MSRRPPRQRSGFGDVAGMNFRAVKRGQLSDAGRLRMPGEDANGMSGSMELREDFLADKAGCSGHKDFHTQGRVCAAFPMI